MSSSSHTHSDSKLWVETQTAAMPLPPGGFVLVSGKTLPRLEIAYETYGALNREQSNAILICSPLTTDAHAAGWHAPEDKKPGWWDDLIGPGKALDTNRYCVIASNMLGGCKGTTGPASVNPATGRPYGSEFPLITVEDMVRAQRLLIEYLGIDTLEAVVGGSMGGMQALQWTVSFPGKVRKCVCIAASAGLPAQALGFEIIGRKIIVNDPDFHGGDYYGTGVTPDRGLAYARMIGHITYLSAVSMHQKFGRQQRPKTDAGRFETGFEVESYLNHQGEQFIHRFDANSYLHITYAMDEFDLESRYGSLENAFRASTSEYLLVALSSDWLFPPEQTRALGQVLLRLKKVASVVELESPYGHDAFLLEVVHLSRVIHSFLERPAYAGAAIHAAPPVLIGPRPAERAAADFAALAGLIEKDSHILDIGCGDGSFIDALFQQRRATGIGIEIDLGSIVECLRKNVPVVQSDVDRGLSLFDAGAFDYAVLNRTLQEVKRPRLLLREMLRVARKGIVAFPNFGHIGNRLSLFRHGTMPVTRALPHHWHETPNIHLFSLLDFRELCARENFVIEKELCFPGSGLSRALLAGGFRNLGAEFVIARLARRP